MSPGLTTVALGGDVAEALDGVPSAAGVGQILGPAEKSLVIGRPANLRRWAASHLGAPRPRKKGVRPPVDLRPIATAVAFLPTTSVFHQRLFFERLMARYVAPSARRDLKPAFYLHVDPEERFPRITIRSGLAGAVARLYGPFRNRASADRARQGILKVHRLRPCDYVFEPDPALPLGLGCVYAQVATCAAPCLVRVTEDAYRAIAQEVADLLAPAGPRPLEIEAFLQPWVASVDGTVGLVSERGSGGLELYPIVHGAVFEEGSTTLAEGEAAETALSRLTWPGDLPQRDDSAWLSSWLHAPRRAGRYSVFPERPGLAALAERLRRDGL